MYLEGIFIMKQLDLFEDSEIWSDISGYEGMYQVSNQGRIRGLDRIIVQKDGKKQKIRGKIISIGIKNNGYYMGQICSKGKMVNLTVHRLMALAFIPKVEGKEYVNHIDGNRANNNLSNLEWVNMKENSLHGVNRAKEEQRLYTSCKKNTPEFILLLRAEYANGKGQTQISKEYGIKYNSLGHILKRRTWKSI